MWERIVDPLGLAVVGVGAFIAFGIGSAVGTHLNRKAGVTDGRKDAALRGLEAALLALFGAMLARLVVSVLCGLADDAQGACTLIGWAMFLWPGAVDFVAWIVEAAGGNDSGWRLGQADILVWIATGVGLLTGLFDGIWRVHNWRGTGWIKYPADVTWGLANTTNGCLFHLVNFTWGDHATDPRTGAHRYLKGFKMKSGFAITQGSVMSNMSGHGPSSALWKHENTHVLQNRIFGPLFTLTYLGWMLVWLVPGLIGAAAKKSIRVVEQWTYFNNPWEAWAYKVGQKHGGSARTAYGNWIWSDKWIGFLSFLFFSLVIAGTILTVLSLWDLT